MMYANPPVATTLAGLGGVWTLVDPDPAFTADSILSRTDAPVSTPPDLLMSANARLMAAAPEMLAALEYYATDQSINGEVARAAVAKALSRD